MTDGAVTAAAVAADAVDAGGAGVEESVSETDTSRTMVFTNTAASCKVHLGQGVEGDQAGRTGTDASTEIHLFVHFVMKRQNCGPCRNCENPSCSRALGQLLVTAVQL